jgi:hypothetical protein
VGASFWLEIVKILLAGGAASFTYFQFFREGTHKQRVEFDIDLCDLGVVGDQRIIEIGCILDNKGNVEHYIDDIRVSIRGLDPCTALRELADHAPRLDFPRLLYNKVSLIPKKWQPLFVRPKVRQRVPLVVHIPADCAHIHIRSTFSYRGEKSIHSAERAFRLPFEVHDV